MKEWEKERQGCHFSQIRWKLPTGTENEGRIKCAAIAKTKTRKRFRLQTAVIPLSQSKMLSDRDERERFVAIATGLLIRWKMSLIISGETQTVIRETYR